MFKTMPAHPHPKKNNIRNHRVSKGDNLNIFAPGRSFLIFNLVPKFRWFFFFLSSRCLKPCRKTPSPLKPILMGPRGSNLAGPGTNLVSESAVSSAIFLFLPYFGEIGDIRQHCQKHDFDKQRGIFSSLRENEAKMLKSPMILFFKMLQWRE